MSIRKPNFELDRLGNNRAIDRAPPAPIASRRRVAPLKAAYSLAALCLVVAMFLASPRSSDAATIASGSNSVDTVYKDDGSEGYVLGSGTSTVSVVDPDTYAITSTIALGVPVNTAMDIDWNAATQRLVVGTSGGLVLTVDPATSTVVTLINNPVANYSQICAENLIGGTIGWGYDSVSGWIHQFFPNGTATPMAPLAVGTPVELVEKKYDPSVPTAQDGYLTMLGTSAGAPAAMVYDRATWTASALMTWPTAPATAAGITTDKVNPDAYVVANGPGPGPGYLLHLNFVTMAFAGPAVKTFTTHTVTDVSMDAQWLGVLHPEAGGPGAAITAFDIGDSTNVLEVGTAVVNTAGPPGGGLSLMAEGLQTLDDLHALYAEPVSNAFGGGGDPSFWEWANKFPGSVTQVPWGVRTGGKPGFGDQEAINCSDCPPEERHGRGGTSMADREHLDKAFSASASVKSVHYSTGEEVFTLPLFSVPGVGIDLDFILTYRSRSDFEYRYGNGWTLNQDVRVRAETNGDRTYFNGHGRADVFQQSGATWTPPLHYESTLAVGGSTTTITNRYGKVTTFDSGGYRTSLADRYGNTITYTWTGDQLTSIADTLGRTYTLSYDTTGRLSSISDFGGRTWTMEYDYLGQLRRVKRPASTQFTSGRTHLFSYSGNHYQTRHKSNLVHVWSPKGDRVQSLEYDVDDFVVKETLGPGTYDISYDVSTSVTTVVDRSGNTKKMTFDSNSVMTRVEELTKGLRTGEPASYVTTYAIGANGLVSHVVYPRGNRKDLTWDANLNLTEVRLKTTNTSSSSSSDIVYGWVYGGAFSQLSQSTDPRGNVTSYTVDASGNTTQITRPTVTSPGSQTITETFAYDTKGRVTSATDGASRKSDFTYYTAGSQNGYLKEVKRDPAGLNLVTTFAYDQYGNVTSITDPKGNATTLTVDAEDYVTQIQAPSPLSYRRKVTYDANRDVTKVEVENVDRKGVQDSTTPWIETKLTYNKLGWLLSREQDLTSTTTATMSYEYQGAGLLTKITTAEAHITTFEYDERDLLFKATRGSGTADATTTQLDYDDNGNLSKLTDGRGNATIYEYDLFDRRTKRTNALGHYSELAYDKSSNLTTITAKDVAHAVQAKTTRHFDEIDRLWKTVHDRFAPGLTTTYPATIITRDKGHLVTEVKDPLNNKTTWTYDAAGRTKDVTDAIGNKVAYTYDKNSNVTKTETTEIPAAGPAETFATEYVFDQVNRTTTVKEIDRLNAGNVLTTTLEYDSRSNLTFRTDAEGNPQRWTYDLASRLTKFERALSVGAQIDDFLTAIEETFAYDDDHRLTTVTDDNFNSTTYEYDALDRRTKTTYAAHNPPTHTDQVTWTYDKASNVKTRLDQNGSLVTDTYDSVDRLTSRSISKGAGVQGTTLETYSYDALNRLTATVDDDYQVELTYDSVGNMLTEKQGYNVSGQEKWKTVTTAFTDAGSLQSIAYPSGFSAVHTRDAIYRLTAIQDAGASVNVSTHTWQGLGRLATTTNQNGTVTEYTYDGFRRVSEIDHLTTGSKTFHKFEYAYDKVHNRRMEKNSFDTTWIATLPTAVQTFLNGRNGKGDVYAYDRAYRMIDVRYDVTNPLTEVSSPGSQTYVTKVAYTLDGLGNRSQVGTTPWGGGTTNVTYASDVVNQYTTVGGTNRTHDGNGNLTDDGTHTYHYDFQNRLTEVKNSGSGTSVATYSYDALGRRVEKAVKAGATTRYVLCRQQVVEEFDGADAWQARYVYEDGIDSPRAMDRADIADVDSDSNTTEILRFHYHQNALGSASEMTQPAGAVVEWVTYDAYGKATVRDRNGSIGTRSNIGNPYLFTGREWDPQAAKYYYRARTYDPAVGRFLQRDPLGYPDGLSGYQYAVSSPATFVDPGGTTPLKPSKGPSGSGEPYKEEEFPDQPGPYASDQKWHDWYEECIAVAWRNWKRAEALERECAARKSHAIEALVRLLRALQAPYTAAITARTKHTMGMIIAGFAGAVVGWYIAPWLLGPAAALLPMTPAAQRFYQWLRTAAVLHQKSRNAVMRGIPLPPGMNVGQFGKWIGWGSQHIRPVAITTQRLHAWGQAGMTSTMARYWIHFYQLAILGGQGKGTPAVRIEFMKRLEEGLRRLGY